MSVFPPPCAISPADKRAQARKVGSDLIKHHGKRRQYTIQQVRDANRRQNIDLDVACWSHAMFNTRAQFDSLHPGHDVSCDFVEMKREMLDAASAHHDASLFDFDLSWIDLSWIEFPDLDWSIFDLFD